MPMTSCAPEVGADEAEGANPGRQRAAGLEEVRARLEVFAQDPADRDDEGEIEAQDQVVDAGQLQLNGVVAAAGSGRTDGGKEGNNTQGMHDGVLVWEKSAPCRIGQTQPWKDF